MTPTHLKSLQALELALRCGSLKEAASRLAITPAATGQRIKALEEYLGAELLVRGRSGLRAGPALQAALPQLTSAFRDLESIAALLDMQRGHEIHIGAHSDLIELWLHPRLGRFRKAFPNVRFCINGEGDAPLRVGPVDCELRFGPPRDGGVTDLLFRDFVLPVGSPEIVARIAGNTRRGRLEGFPLLHLDFYKDDPAVPDWPEWVRAHRLTRTEPNRGIRYQRIGTALAAVLADAGVAICGLALLSPYIDDGQLALPFAVSSGAWTQYAFQARFRSDALARPQVKRFREWLDAEAAGTRQWLEGHAAARRSARKR